MRRRRPAQRLGSSTSEPDEVERLRALLLERGLIPAPDVRPAPDLDEATSARIWARVQAARALEQGSEAERFAGSRQGRSPRRRVVGVVTRSPRLAAGLAVAAAALAVVLVVQPGAQQAAVADTPPLLSFSILDEGSTASGATSAADELTALAATAADHAVPVAGPDGYTISSASWSLASIESASGTSAAVIPYRTTTRVSEDGRMDRVERLGAALTTDGRGLAPGGDPLDAPRRQHDTFPPGSVDTDLMSRLPRDPDGLRRELLREQGCPPSSGAAATAECLVRAVTGLYATHLVPADLQAALWRVLAADDGVRYLGTGTDRAGRACAAVAVQAGSGDRERWILLIDTATGAYLGDEHVLVAGTQSGVDAPAILEFTTLLDAG